MSDLVQIEPPRRRDRPPWLRIRYRQTPELERLRGLVRDLDLHTVCQSAACPNLAECWSAGTATFMIGGDLCTRRCGFCDVATGRPEPLDPIPSTIPIAVLIVIDWNFCGSTLGKPIEPVYPRRSGKCAPR